MTETQGLSCVGNRGQSLREWERSGMIQASSVKRSIVFFLVPNFSMIAFATAIEPLRIANRMLGYDAY
ncbi:hypothetical protein LNK15_14500, partial [Jeotgalicoccus huakuii]|nr:hypothetical protein [Jeotgalicoccus huakuii]